VLGADGGEGCVEPTAQDLNNAAGIAMVACMIDAQACGSLLWPRPDRCKATCLQNKDPPHFNSFEGLSCVIRLLSSILLF
jgi:hypothetical protein